MNPLNPSPTPFDICWRMFGIHVRVNPGFWLFSAGFGWYTGFAQEAGNFKWSYLATWVVATFISVLIHELGHVIMGRLCGQKGNIVLQAFGGAAVGQYQLCNRWQQMAIALAGPAIGLTLFGTVWLLVKPFDVELMGIAIQGPQLMNRPGAPWAGMNVNWLWLWRGVNFLMLMTIMWNLLNLIPVIPMDGGQVVRAAFRGYTSPNGLRCALAISMVVASGVAIFSYMALSNPDLCPTIPSWATLIAIPARMDPTFNAIFFAFMAVQNLFMLITARRQVFSTEDEVQEPDVDRDRRRAADRDRDAEREAERLRYRD